jgi:predicted Zn-dependent protease
LNPTERIQYLQQLMLNDPKDSFLKYALALEFNNLGNLDDAIDLLESLRFDEPNYTPTYYTLGSIYIEQGETDKARKVIEEGMTLTQNKDSKTYNELQALLDELE